MRLTTRAALVDACSMSFSHVVATTRLGTTARKPMRLTVRGAVVVPALQFELLEVKDSTVF